MWPKDITDFFCSCLLVVYGLSVVSAWVGLYRLWWAHFHRRTKSDISPTVRLLGWLLVVIVSFYTIFAIPWLLAPWSLGLFP